MGGYLVNFAIYVMAMLGLIFFALLVYQKASKTGTLGLRKSNFLGVEDTLSIGARKNLYVVRAGNERFLIAGDMDKTSLIAKLEDGYNTISNENIQPKRTIQQTQFRKPVPTKSVDDLPVIVDFQHRKNGSDKKIIQSMMKKINE